MSLHPDTIKVGDPVSQQMYSDRHASTVVATERSGRRIQVRRESVRLVPGAGMGSQDWIITENLNGPCTWFTFRKNGRYVAEGETQSGTPYLRPGHNHYYDWSF